jgi:hypothetical protein
MVYILTNFSILVLLFLGTKNSKAAILVFESASMKASADAAWPGFIPLGDISHRLIRVAPDAPEMVWFKFRKGTFYVYAVRIADTRADSCALEDHVWFEDRWMVASWCDE